MRNVVVSTSGVGYSQPVPLDQAQNPENAALVAVIAGSPTYNLEYSLDNPFDPQFANNYPNSYNTNANWIALTGLSNLTVNANGNIAFGARAVRINQTAGVAASVTLTVSQTGLRGG